MGHPGMAVVALVFLVTLVGLYVGSVVWAYGDARARGKSGFLVALLVALLSWPGGLLAWLVFRPKRRPPCNAQSHAY
jgi:hypothetical protein